MSVSSMNHTSSRIWCRGCEEYCSGDGCSNKPAVQYGKRLGNTKETVPCWLIRGTVYCKFEDKKDE